jgi:acetoacetate decarboxylase
MRVTYPNATVIVPVSMNDTQGFYMARVYEGSPDAAMLTIWGREIWGFPKIAADTNVCREGDFTSSYVRAGNASASVALKLQEKTHIEPAATLNLYCRKTIPSADNQGPDLDRIIEVPWRRTDEHRISGEVKRFTVRLYMRGKSTKLPVDEYVDAFWFTQDGGTVLDKGKVVHDYLK